MVTKLSTPNVGTSQSHEAFTYRHVNLKDNTLDENLSAALPTEVVPFAPSSPTEDLGYLNVLPLELIQEIFLLLDLYSLSQLRNVNRLARTTIDSTPQYRAIAKYSPILIPCIRKIHTAQWVNCMSVYKKLCTAECEECGDFGNYLYVLGICKRVCFLCLSQHRNYLPLLDSHAIRKFGLSREILNGLPHMKSIPGKYSPNGKILQKVLNLVDYQSAFDAGLELHGSLEAMEQFSMDAMSMKIRQYESRITAAEQSGSERPRIRQPTNDDPFDGKSGNPMRYVAVVCVPWFNRISQKAEWGFHCSGCRRCYASRPLHYRRKFIEASFHEHVEQCGSIVNGKHQI